MGCGSSSTQDNNGSNNNNNNQNNNNGNNDTNFPYQDILTNNEFKKFQDMPETTKDRYIGEGIMKIHNYKCPLPIDKLESLREQFWLTRNQADKNWKILKSCMGLDETEVNQILSQNDMVCVQNTIQNTYNKLQPSYIYHLPNFVISDPIYEREYANYEEIYDSIEDNIINVKLSYITQGRTYDVKIRNKDTGFDIIHKFIKLSGIDNRLYVIRVFYGGQEIEETHCVYYHQIKNGDTLQIITTERGETADTYSKVFSKKNERRVGVMEKLKKIANGEEVEDDMSVGYQESIMTTGQEGEKENEVIGAGKVKKKKKGKKKKKKNEEIKEEKSENEEDVKEKRW
jgi:hypothetical protein